MTNRLSRIIHWLLVAAGLVWLAGGARAQGPASNAIGGQVTATWTSATTGGASGARLLIPMAAAIGGTAGAGFSTATIDFTASGTLSGGVITFEGTVDSTGNTGWKTVPCSRGGATPSSDTTYTLTGANQIWQCSGAGLQYLSARLSTAISGTGSAILTGQATSAESKWFSVSIAPPTTNGASVQVIAANDNSNPFTPVTPRVTSANNMNGSSSSTPGGGLAGNGYLITATPNKFWQSSSPGVASAATVTFSAPGAGKSWVLDCMQATAWIAAGQTTAATTVTLQVTDGGANTYFQKQVAWNAYANTATSGAASQGMIYDMQPICGLGIVAAQNASLTVAWSAGGTQVRESVSAGAYLVQ